MTSLLPSGTRLLLAAVFCLLGVLPLSACQDLDTDPLALAVAPETHGALILTQLLPSVPVLLSEVGGELEGSADLEAWWESWDMSEVEGERLRSRIYPPLARRILPELGEKGVEDLLDRNQANLSAVEDAGVLVASAEIRSTLVRARDLQDQARSALGKGDVAGAIAFVLRSVDSQWALSPAQVARSLVGRADRSLRRVSDTDTYSDEELSRIRRLTRGAQQALEAGDYPRAIRRAYYACQLLGVDPP